jgi:hypothetical protein
MSQTLPTNTKTNNTMSTTTARRSAAAAASAPASADPKDALRAQVSAISMVEGLDIESVLKSNQAQSDWVAGLPKDTYRPAFDDNGELKTFDNAAGDKVSGYMVIGENSGERKLYKKFLALADGVEGVEELDVKGGTMLFPINATFGIQAAPDTDRPKESYNGVDRHPLKHTLIS